MTVFEWLRLILGGALLFGGIFVFVTGVIGNFRFSYALCRMHAAGLGDTLGIVLVFLGLTVLEGVSAFTLKLWLTAALLWVSSPTASHRIMQMEIRRGSSAGKEQKK